MTWLAALKLFAKLCIWSSGALFLKFREFRREDWLHVLFDLGFAVYMVTGIFGLIGVIVGASGLQTGAAVSYAREVSSGLGVSPFLDENMLLGLVAFVLLTTYVDYWTHRLFHAVPFLWEFHKVHHSATRMTGLSQYRAHPFEVSAGIIFAPLLALLLPALETIVFASVYSVSILIQHTLTHTEWRSSWGWVGRVIVSPAAHQIHHSTNPAHFNSNYGSPLVIWDRLHGTYLDPLRTEPPKEYGIDGVRHTGVVRDSYVLLVRPVIRAFLTLRQSLAKPLYSKVTRDVAP
jgi:sterol desaturase/sphingolipid hydroxylase (fatty acid hydroxylase superfamily)